MKVISDYLNEGINKSVLSSEINVQSNISLSSEINIDNARLLYNNGNCSDEIKNTILTFFTEDELNK